MDDFDNADFSAAARILACLGKTDAAKRLDTLALVLKVYIEQPAIMLFVASKTTAIQH